MSRFALVKIVIMLQLFFFGSANAGIIFSFIEQNGNVVMESSGSIDTAGLRQLRSEDPGSVVVQAVVIDTSTSDRAPNEALYSFLSVTDVNSNLGLTDVGFGFNTGTDTSAWFGAQFPFFISADFSLISGNTQFSNLVEPNSFSFPSELPGLSIGSEDLVGSIWTPNVVISAPGNFNDLGLTEGTYTITDALSGEFVSIQIGNTVDVPEPLTFFTFAAGLMGMAWYRRKQPSVV